MNFETAIQPAGATHFGPACQHPSNNWFRLDHGQWSVWRSGYGWTECPEGLQPLRLDTMVELKPTPWTGEGRPPVGVPLEYQRRGAPNGKWYPTQINFLSGQHVIFCDSDGDEIRENPEDILFRPIRTPEQIAADNRRNSAIALYGAVMDHSGQAFDLLPKERQEHYLKLVDQGWQQVPRA